MPKITHSKLAEGRWNTFSLAMQMGNIGSEVNRLLQWRGTNAVRADKALERALELIDLTISDSRWKLRVGEFLRLREVVADLGQQKSSLEIEPSVVKNYFLPFAARALR